VVSNTSGPVVHEPNLAEIAEACGYGPQVSGYARSSMVSAGRMLSLFISSIFACKMIIAVPVYFMNRTWMTQPAGARPAQAIES
jgi:hypothetical protein